MKLEHFDTLVVFVVLPSLIDFFFFLNNVNDSWDVVPFPSLRLGVEGHGPVVEAITGSTKYLE